MSRCSCSNHPQKISRGDCRKCSTTHTSRFFFAYELPKSEGLATRLLASDGLTLEPTAELF